MKAIIRKCSFANCSKKAVASVFGQFCKAHTKGLCDRRSAVRVSYKVKRIANAAWGLGITLTNRDTVTGTGGGEFRLIAAFDTNEELADWIKYHPAPKPFVGTLPSAEAKVVQWTGYYHTELAAKIFWGQASPRTQSHIEEFKAAKRLKESPHAA